jgi:hypothetical protein
MRYRGSFLFALLFICSVGCKKQFDNPNAASLSNIPFTPEGLVNLMVGIKNRFAVNSSAGGGAVFQAITMNGFTTDEIFSGPGGNLDFNQLATGGQSITTNNSVLADLWSSCLLVNYHASLILENITTINDPGLNINVQKYALLYKAMAIGTMVNFWQQIPIETGINASFVDSSQALRAAIDLLNQALSLPDAPVDPRLGTEINLRNSALALSARYYLMLGNYDSAIARAGAVTINPASGIARSVFVFNNINPNPVFRSGFNAQFAYRPRDSMGLSQSTFPFNNDTLRLRFYSRDQNPSPSLYSSGFWKNDADSIPLYLPGEMLLIQAESYTRKGDLVNGKRFLDLVLTKQSNQDAFRLGANQPPYAGPLTQEALLLEIYRNRCVELFMSGLKLPDSRRFRRPGPTDPRPERRRNYFPYPQQEALGNPNTPPNPDI